MYARHEWRAWYFKWTRRGISKPFYLLYYHAILGRDLIHFVIRFLCLRTCPWLLTIILSFAPNCTAVPHAISFHFRKCGERVALIVMKTNMPRKYVALSSDHIDRDCKDWMFLLAADVNPNVFQRMWFRFMCFGISSHVTVAHAI